MGRRNRRPSSIPAGSFRRSKDTSRGGKAIPRKLISNRPKVERVFLAGVELRGQRQPWKPEDSLAELGELARSADARVVGSTVQRVNRLSQHYLGKGKIEELRGHAQEGRFDTLICDDELSPTQQKNLEDALGTAKVIDRTALILDVFARRAQSHEGRLQVELAQHEYLLPRLAGQWAHLERLGGGIGTRGPGETQIETDRRLVRGRIQRIKKSLQSVRRHRGQYRTRRKERGFPVASLVGYTNAGKSTLLNSLTGASVPVEDKLFSTLDPVTRRIRLSSGRELLLTDTVGFIQKLPPAVVAAFRATLEEIEETALIVHVVDIAHPNAGAHAEVVEGILEEMGLADKPRILVLNKVDLLESRGAESLGNAMNDVAKRPRTVMISALQGTGIDNLLAELDDMLSEVASSELAGGVVAG